MLKAPQLIKIKKSNRPLYPDRLENIYNRQKDAGYINLNPITEHDIKIRAKNKRQKEIILSIINQLPKKQVVHDKLKAIAVLNDTSFLAKHNNKDNVIYLSSKLFTPQYQAKRPFHRIDGIPSLVELLTHEIGHSVDRLYSKGDDNTAWMKKFGWVYPKDRNEVQELISNGYTSAMTHFNNISDADRLTLEPGDDEDIKKKIKQRYPMEKNGSEMNISWYGKVSPAEDFAESYCQYRWNNKNFEGIDPVRSKYMQLEIFDSEIYDS